MIAPTPDHRADSCRDDEASNFLAGRGVPFAALRQGLRASSR